MKAKVDEDLCVGSGFCVETCPQVFELSDDVAKVKVDRVPPDAEEACRKAMQDCPSGAISLSDD